MNLQITKDIASTYLIDCLGYSEQECQEMDFKECIQLIYSKQETRAEFLSFIS